jgi:hypothetical protein
MAILSALRLLVDTDAFCKLGVSGLLPEAVDLLGADLTGCGRLAALPYMLRRGRLRKAYGPEACDALVTIADTMPAAPLASDAWLEKLVPIQAIDPGEAQIFAASAEAGLFVVSGDKRALRELKRVVGFPEALAGRVVLLEAILLALSDRHGSELVRHRVEALHASDKMVEICFSDESRDPRAGLLSYYRSAVTELAPLILWDPQSEGAP